MFSVGGLAVSRVPMLINWTKASMRSESALLIFSSGLVFLRSICSE